MSYEVELKFQVPDTARFEAKMAALHAKEIAAVRQVDHYFRHPARDFAVTDEAFRIRSVGERNWLTYKGPKLDRATKTRREIEIPFGDSPNSAEQMQEMLHLLGFRPALAVSKQRRRFLVEWDDHEVEAVLDTVEGLGTFAELELMTDDISIPAARAIIISLAEHCQLGEHEIRSYLELLLEKAADSA